MTINEFPKRIKVVVTAKHIKKTGKNSSPIIAALKELGYKSFCWFGDDDCFGIAIRAVDEEFYYLMSRRAIDFDTHFLGRRKVKPSSFILTRLD